MKEEHIFLKPCVVCGTMCPDVIKRGNNVEMKLLGGYYPTITFNKDIEYVVRCKSCSHEVVGSEMESAMANWNEEDKN